VGEQLRREVLAADYLQTDDTSVTVLDDPTGSYKGRLWTYLDPLGRQVVFDATRTHERDGPEAVPAGFCRQAAGRRLYGVRRDLRERAHHRDRLLGPWPAALRRGVPC
jgi:hypothetical protein